MPKRPSPRPPRRGLMPKYEVKVEAWDIMTICAENEDDAQEQATDHFHKNYVLSKVDVEKLESDEEDTE